MHKVDRHSKVVRRTKTNTTGSSEQLFGSIKSHDPLL